MYLPLMVTLLCIAVDLMSVYVMTVGLMESKQACMFQPGSLPAKQKYQIDMYPHGTL